MFNPSSKFKIRVKSKMWKRWQLFHATDFQSLMYPCFALSSILGIYPYKINTSVFETSRSRYILLLIITCATCVYELGRIYENNILNIDHNNVTKKILNNCYFTSEVFIIIVTFILTGPRMRLLQTILEVSSKLPPKSYEKLSKFIHVKDIFGFIFLMGYTLLEFHHLYKKGDLYGDFYVILITMEKYINFLTFQMSMLYVNCVCILKACFKRINDNLINLQELMINNKSHVSGSIYYQERNSLVREELKALQKAYLIVSAAVKMLNIIFTPQLLATIATIFIEINFELYTHMVQWQNGLSINVMKQICDTIGMYYITYQITKIALIIWACETGKNQDIKIRTTVHDILNSTSDEEIKNELHLFSLQLLQCNNTFSAKCFTVDATLITVMVDTISTYLLILIQFFVMQHS